MNRRIYFGTRERMEWVPAPKIELERGTMPWSSRADRLDGTVGIRRSAGGARQYHLEWPMKHSEDMDFVQGVLNGDFNIHHTVGTSTPIGDANRLGVFMLDPFAMTSNILPEWWASPSVAIRGGRPLVRKSGLVSKNNLQPSNKRQPLQGVEYQNLSTASGFSELPIPIPPGFTLHLGFVGATWAGSGLRIDKSEGGTDTPTLLSSANTALTNYSYSNTSGVTRWRTLRVHNAGNLALYNGYGVILPNGAPAPSGNWRPGQGAGVLQPEARVDRVGLSAALDRERLSVVLVEVDQ